MNFVPNLLLFGLPCVLALQLCIVRKWKWGLLALVAFMPFSGLPTLAFYPAPAWTRLLKDVLFIVPLYGGLALAGLLGRRFVFPRRVMLPMVGLAILVVMHCFDPAVPNFLVAAVGLKTWLFYLPMLFVGFALVNTVEDLVRFARFTVWIATIPAGFGLVQAALYYGGKPDAAYAIYGEAAHAATQMFTKFGADDSGFGIVRLPSIFSYVMQYLLFLLCMLPLAFGLAVRQEQRRRERWVNYGFVLLLILAGFASGSRGAFLIFPAFLVIAALLSGRARRAMKRLVGVGVAVITGLVVAGSLLGGGISPLVGYIWEMTSFYLSGALFAHFQLAFSITLWGVGTGTATGPARLAFDSAERALFDLEQVENFYAKAIVELGVPGLVMVVWLFAVIGWQGYRGFRRLDNKVLRAFGAALLSFYIVVLVYLIKGSLLDYDPINVYFWLLCGVLLKLPRLDRVPPSSELGEQGL